MYYCWDKHGMLPSVYYNMDIGERLILKAFFERKMESKENLHKSLGDSPIFPVRII